MAKSTAGASRVTFKASQDSTPIYPISRPLSCIIEAIMQRNDLALPSSVDLNLSSGDGVHDATSVRPPSECLSRLGGNYPFVVSN